MAKFYLSQSTFVALKKLPMKASMRVILETVSSASEFSSIRFRTGEKAPLIKANKARFPLLFPCSYPYPTECDVDLAEPQVPGCEARYFRRQGKQGYLGPQQRAL